MKSEKRMLFAFLLNAGFSLFELAGGLLTGSIAIASDAVHDMGDAAGIGFSLYLEKKANARRMSGTPTAMGGTRFWAVSSPCVFCCAAHWRSPITPCNVSSTPSPCITTA